MYMNFGYSIITFMFKLIFKCQYFLKYVIEVGMGYTHFLDTEEKKLIRDIEDLLDGGYSIYSACMILANRDKKLARRYYDKYRSISKYKDNIVTIRPVNKKLTDDDINSLIMGIVGLIKKSTAHDVSTHYKGIIEEYHIRLNSTLVELNKKNNLLNTVLAENEKLKGEVTHIDSLYSRIKGK